MRILAAGGGSGGHVSPVVAVINEIAKKQSAAEFLFVCDTSFEVQARGLMEKGSAVPVAVKTITAGKFRRYSHLSLIRHLTIPSIVFANIRDLFKIAIGFFQSIAIIIRFKPDVVFAKGGFVCLPLGMAARIMRVPIVVHDSDTRPGLTNSFLGRWAAAIATGSPLENYRYPAAISHYVGVPIGAEFSPYTAARQQAAKQQLGFDLARPLIVVTGGGLGAVTINDAMVVTAKDLLADNVQMYHVTGRKNYDEIAMLAPKDDAYKVVPFVYEGMADVLGAADIVISRASATFIQELAGLKKTAILVPSRALGDQRKNAVVYKEAEAAVVLTDDEIAEPKALYNQIHALLAQPAQMRALAERLHSFARPHAARDVAEIIVQTATKRRENRRAKQ